MKKFIMGLMMSVCVCVAGMVVSACSSKAPEVLNMFALNKIELFVQPTINSTIKRIELNKLTTRVGQNTISEIDINGYYTSNFSGAAMLESHMVDGVVDTKIKARQENPFKLEIGRNEHNKFEKEKSVKIVFSYLIGYSSYVLDENTYVQIGDYGFVSHSGSEDISIIISTNNQDNFYNETVTLYSNINAGFNIKAKLNFVKI